MVLKLNRISCYTDRMNNNVINSTDKDTLIHLILVHSYKEFFTDFNCFTLVMYSKYVLNQITPEHTLPVTRDRDFDGLLIP